MQIMLIRSHFRSAHSTYNEIQQTQFYGKSKVQIYACGLSDLRAFKKFWVPKFPKHWKDKRS